MNKKAYDDLNDKFTIKYVDNLFDKTFEVEVNKKTFIGDNFSFPRYLEETLEDIIYDDYLQNLRLKCLNKEDFFNYLNVIMRTKNAQS